MKRRRMLVAAIAASVVVGSFGIASPAYATPDYPSWGDVQNARQSEASKQAEITRITALSESLHTAAENAGIAVLQAGEAYQVALETANEAEATLTDLQARLTTAQADAAASLKRVGSLIARLQRTGSVDVTATMLVGSADPDDTLYRLGALTRLSSRSADTLERAQRDANEVDSLTAQADLAATALETARAEAETKLTEAQTASDAAEAAVTENEATQGELASQLAYLQDTSLSVESAYAAGVAARAQAAADAAAAAAAARPPVQSPGGGTPQPPAPPAGGGGTTPPATTPPPAQPPAAPASAAQSAVNFAYAQLGKWYVFAGEGPNVWDCSGLTLVAYRQAGIYIGYHTVGAQYRQMQAIGRLAPTSGGLVPGDLLYYSEGSTTNSYVMYHTTIYVGGGMMIEAPEPGRQVQLTPVRTRNLVPYVGRPAG